MVDFPDYGLHPGYGTAFSRAARLRRVSHKGFMALARALDTLGEKGEPRGCPACYNPVFLVASETAMPQGDENNDAAGAVLDARGLLCPEPVMLLHNRIRDLAPGDELEVLATDPSTERDIPRFCQFLGHSLVQHERDGELYRYRIRKKG